MHYNLMLNSVFYYYNLIESLQWACGKGLKMKVKVAHSLWPHRLYSPLNSPGQNTGVGTLSFLQGIFPTQGSNPGLPHWRRILYKLSHKGSPWILEWVAYPFSSGSSWPRNQTRVSCIAGGFFTNWAIREAPVPIFAEEKAEVHQVNSHKMRKWWR